MKKIIGKILVTILGLVTFALILRGIGAEQDAAARERNRYHCQRGYFLATAGKDLFCARAPILNAGETP